jgi:GTP-binding protein Era
MPTFRDLLNSLPSDTQDMLRMVWETLPPSEQQNLQNVFKAFPSETNLMRLLINLSMVEFRMAFGRKHSVVIVGPANVGKSTLYNQLIHTKSDRAEVSPLPGTTRINQLGDVGLFSLVDTPGADAIGEVGEHEKELAFQAAGQADFLIILFDAIQGIKKTELELFEELKTLGKPYIIVLNKIDLVRKEVQKVTERAAANLRVPTEQIVQISAKDGKNIERVLLAIAAAEPEIVAALGKAMPAYRWQLAWRAIVSAASVSAVIALTPLPFIDFAPLVITQSVMILGIARIYNYEITPKRARELVATFGLGFLGRTLFQELSKLGGIPGWLLSAAIASSTTVAMGYAAAVWFERGERLSNDRLKEITKSMTTTILQSLRGLGKKKPSREALQESISQALNQADLPTSPSQINTNQSISSISTEEPQTNPQI